MAVIGSKVRAAMAREGLEEGRMPMGEIWVLGRRPQLSLHLSDVATLPYLGIPAFWNYQDPALVRMDWWLPLFSEADEP